MGRPTMADQEYNELGQKIANIVSSYCYFANAIIRTQCKRMNKASTEINKEDLLQLSSWIGSAVAAFTNPVKGQEVEKAILQLNDSK